MRGFSLIETLVVMAIIAVITGLGITSFVVLRNRTISRQAVSEYIENHNNVRNEARNNVLTGAVINSDLDAITAAQALDYRIIYFGGENGTPQDSYTKGTCQCALELQQNLNYDYTNCLDDPQGLVCTFQQGDLKSDNNDEIVVQPATSNCNALLFSTGVGEITFANADGLAGANVIVQNLEQCDFNFSHQSTPGVPLTLTIDATNNSFEIN